MNNCTTLYYASLSDAITDINSGTTNHALTDSTTAKIKVVTGCTGSVTVYSLADEATEATIIISRDVTLELADRQLSFTGDGCLELAESTAVTIRGGTLQRTIGATATKLYLVQAAGSLTLDGTTCQISGYQPSGFIAIKATSTCPLLDISNATVSAINGETESNTLVKGIQTQATRTKIQQSTVTAECGNFCQAIYGMGSIATEGSTISCHSRTDVTFAVYSASGDLTIRNSLLTADSDAEVAYAVCMSNGTAKIEGSTINASSATHDTYSVFLNQGCVTVEGCSIHAVTSGSNNVRAKGIYINVNASAKVKDSQITGDANYYQDITERRSVAVDNNGIAVLENVTADATYTAIWNRGKLYVNGGTYNGFTYGGFVLYHGENGEAFINDAVIRGGNYSGSFDFGGEGYSTGAMYLIGANTEAYVDGCTFDASNCDRSIIIRGVPGETNNSLYISNSTVDDGTLNQGAIRLDNNTMMLHVGLGTNITSARLKNGFTAHDETGKVLQYPADYEEEGVVEYTDMLYRRQPEDHICSGNDWETMSEAVNNLEEQAVSNAMSVVITTTQPQETITQNFLRPKNGHVQFFLYVPPVSEGAVTTKAAFKIGDVIVFEGFLMSNPFNCGTALVEYHLRKDFPCGLTHYFTHGAGLADLHASGMIPGTAEDTVTVVAPTDHSFPTGTQLHICAIES